MYTWQQKQKQQKNEARSDLQINGMLAEGNLKTWWDLWPSFFSAKDHIAVESQINPPENTHPPPPLHYSTPPRPLLVDRDQEAALHNTACRCQKSVHHTWRQTYFILWYTQTYSIYMIYTCVRGPTEKTPPWTEKKQQQDKKKLPTLCHQLPGSPMFQRERDPGEH